MHDAVSAAEPLTALPRFPDLAGYRELRTALDELRLPHAVDLLYPPGDPGNVQSRSGDRGFTVLDGVWLPGPGPWSTRVDAAYLDKVRQGWLDSGDPGTPVAVAVLDRLREAVVDDPMALRRIVFYQVCCLLRDRNERADEAAAVALGVDVSEAAEVALIAQGFPAPGQYREAAAAVSDAVRERRFQQAAGYAEVLAEVASDDFVLRALLDRIRQQTELVDGLRARAAEQLGNGDALGSAQSALGALRQSTDCAGALTDLLVAAAACADTRSRAAELSVEAQVPGDRAVGVVELSWPSPSRSSEHTGYRVLRFAEGGPQDAVEIAVIRTGSGATDPAAPLGCPLRYAVVPVRGILVHGIPLVSTVLTLIPEVEALCAVAVPDGLALTWRPHPEVSAVKVLRRRSGEQVGQVGGGPDRSFDRLTDAPLNSGRYNYRVLSGCRLPDGTMQWSSGRTVTARAIAWPSAADTLVAEPPQPGSRAVLLRWTPPVRGEARVVRWRGRPVAPGEDLSDCLLQLSDGLVATAPESHGSSVTVHSTEVVPTEGTNSRYLAVSVLGQQAVAGPSVLIGAIGAISDLTVSRTDDSAEVVVCFNWPEPAVLVLVRCEQDGLVEEMRIARSRYLAAGLRLPVGRGPARLTVVPLGRPDALLLSASPATADLPAVPAPPPGDYPLVPYQQLPTTDGTRRAPVMGDPALPGPGQQPTTPRRWRRSPGRRWIRRLFQR